jgi:hypothetical protein
VNTSHIILISGCPLVAYADISRPDIAGNVATDDEEDEEDEDEEEADGKDKKPKNAMRKVSKPRVGEDEEYLRYYILASEVATCS